MSELDATIRNNTIFPSLVFKDAAIAIEYYKKLFGAVETYKRLVYEGKIVHAEITIGSSTIMLSDEMHGMKAPNPESQDMPVTLYMYADNVDEVFDRATKLVNGLTITIQYMPETQFYGDRIAAFIDPFGYKWTIATHVKDVSREDAEKHLPEMMAHAKQEMSGGGDKYMLKYYKYKEKYLRLKNIL